MSSRQKLPLDPDPVTSADLAGLRYTSDDEPGYSRRPWGRGFSYFDPDGRRVRDPELRARFVGLAIPPAWEDVWICRWAHGHLQATGRDNRRRKQYRYHPLWSQVRKLTKFNRLIPFGEALPAIRAQVDADLRRRRLTLPKVVAIVVHLLESTHMRIGNAEYQRRNGTVGLTTLATDHLEITGTTLRFTYRAKSGQEREVTLADPRLARQVRRCEELPGKHLFQYLDENGERRSVDSGDVNNYLREITGEPFTAKDFRTWSGTVLAGRALLDRPPPAGEVEGEAVVQETVASVANALGNTKAVCRRYYIHPAVFDGYRDGTLQAVATSLRPRVRDEDALDEAEQIVLALLRERPLTLN